MKHTQHQIEKLKRENEELRLRLQESRATLDAIRSGEVDALVVDGLKGKQVFSLKGVNYSYRILIEEMQEGAITLSEKGSILYANQFMEKMLATPLEKIIGSSVEKFVHLPDLSDFQTVLKQSERGHASAEIKLATGKGKPLPAYLSANRVSLEEVPVFCLTFTDLTDQKRHEKILAEERLSRSIIDQSADAIIVCDDRGTVIRASRVAFDLVGRNCMNERFNDAFTIHIQPEDPDRSGQDPEFEVFTIDRVISGKTLHSYEAFIKKDGGSVNHLLLSASPLKNDSGQVIGAIVNIADITEKIRLERRLRESEEWLATTLNSIGDGIIASDESGRVVLMNPVAEQLTGWTEAEAIGKPINEIFAIVNEETGLKVENPLARVMREGVVVGLANHSLLITKDGRKIPIADSGSPINDDTGKIIGAVMVFRDQTLERAAQQAISTSLGEKEVLLKEIHHRVKNNMQVISSLMALQVEESRDAGMRDVLLDVIHRVRSMAMIHEKLYESADLARVEFAEYAKSLLSYLWHAQGTAVSGIRLDLDLEPVSLSVNTAVPCGLILNELVSNALKYAFRGRAGGEVGVSLRCDAQSRVRLCVCDNGRGLPAGLDWTRARSLGLRLVKMLAGQIDADVEVSGREGTEFVIGFEEPKT